MNYSKQLKKLLSSKLNCTPEDFDKAENIITVPALSDGRFPNAICDKFKSERPDTLAVCAYIDGKTAGMAGCSEDAKDFQQIGIDVIPQFRSKGVGSYLVALLKNEIENAAIYHSTEQAFQISTHGISR